MAERGSALVLAAFLEVHIGGAHDADGVEAGVLEETLVFGGGNGVDQHFWNVAKFHQAALFAIAVEEIGDELRLKLILGAGGVIAQGNDLRDAAVRRT